MTRLTLETVLDIARSERACMHELLLLKSLGSWEAVLSSEQFVYWISWYAPHLPPELKADFGAYREATWPLREAYREATASVGKAYREAVWSLRDAYQGATSPEREAYRKVTAPEREA